MSNSIEILSGSSLYWDINSISETLEEISSWNSRWWILPRNRSYFQKAIEENRMVVSRINSEITRIIWASLIEELSQNWAELWTFFVDPEYRSHGIAGKMINELVELWERNSKNLLMTMKPNILWSEWMIISATKNWFLPVSFNFLSNDRQWYNNCCVCDDNLWSENCLYRDNYCILWVHSNITWSREASLEYINSPNFISAIQNESVRSRVLNNVLNIINS